MSPDRAVRLRAATLAAAEMAILGYSLLRLLSAARGEPDPRYVVEIEHVGLFWRASTALWWAAMAAAAAWRYPAVGDRLAAWLLPVVLIATISMIAVP